MRNVRINEAETIFETFWDSGESYPNHHKYTCLSQYTVTTDGKGEIAPSWNCVRIALYPGPSEDFPITMERSCALNIKDYDRFRLFARIPERVEFIVECVIDGETRRVIRSRGRGGDGEYTEAISGDMITGIRFSFRNTSGVSAFAELTWLGLSNHEKEAAMLAQETPYTPDWEGCFRDDADMTPQMGLFFDARGLEVLRKKVDDAPFNRIMNKIREKAEEYLAIEPERYVGDYLNTGDRRMVRERDAEKPNLKSIMPTLAFVGLMDRNETMLRMACRMALSVAHSRYFCESIMGVFPGATWHHRSFLEGDTCEALSFVLDWAGGLLTWHGANIIYDAMIIKGLPRMDADVKTMDYIWEMNQGPVFTSRLVTTLIALSKRYPRYAARVDEAEKDLMTMWNNYMQPDGGDAEGPAYWDFTLSYMSTALRLLARHHGMSLADYLPNTIRESVDFAEAILTGDGFHYMPVNDAHPGGHFSEKTVGLLAEANMGDIWRLLNNRLLESDDQVSISDVIFGQIYDIKDMGESKRVFISLPDTGVMTLRRNTTSLGTVSLSAFSGVSTFGHGHADKGSFIIEAGSTPLLIDPGVVNYSDADVDVIGLSERHNVITAVIGGRHLSQGHENPSLSAKVLEAKYKNGSFSYATDITRSWNGVFDMNIRRIRSDDPLRYVIEDELEIAPSYGVCFVLNTYGDIHMTDEGAVILDSGKKVAVVPRNWKPDKIEFAPCGTDGNKRLVNRLCLYVSGRSSYHLITEIRLSKE